MHIDNNKNEKNTATNSIELYLFYFMIATDKMIYLNTQIFLKFAFLCFGLK